jgi:glycine betaine catabolism A
MSATTLLEQLRAQLATGAPATTAPFTLPPGTYNDPAVLERERALFTAPYIAAVSSQLPRGGWLPVDRYGRSILLGRGEDGVVRAFANACRHRAARLVDAPCSAKALVCRYHGWTYDARGALIHVPHADAFPGCEHRDLRAVEVGERHGLIWLGRGDLAAHLAGIDGDLAALDFTGGAVWRSERTVRRCNWKLVIEAFIEAYHLRTLHRDSIYRFFLDRSTIVEREGLHHRAFVGRRALRDAPASELRELVTPSYLIFPATVIIVHPDFISIIVLEPLAADTSVVQHTMVIPAARAGETEHWMKSWDLIDGGVLQGEDLWACEQIQRGLGETDELLFGSLEHAIRDFHATIAATLAQSAP